MDFSSICQDIINLDSKIRFAGICDDSGEIKYGGQRHGVPNLLTSEEIKRSVLQALAIWSLRYSLSSKIGRGKYAMAEYEKIKRITIPLQDGQLLLISTETDADHVKIIEQVLNMIK